ncbi:MAG: hypothetical protein ACK5AC_01640 [Planctomycetota bacterium]
MEWIELPRTRNATPLNDRAIAFIQDGRRRMREIDCFDFVPSNYEVAWEVLSNLSRGRFCEWGSGLGIAVGLAEILGFQAIGIELDANCAAASRELLREHGLSAVIETGSYFDRIEPADYYYVYAWPSQRNSILEYFCQTASEHSRLLFWESQDDVRLGIRPSTRHHAFY